MPIAMIQSDANSFGTIATGESSKTLTLSYDTPTTAGNLLIALVVFNTTNQVSDVMPTITMGAPTTAGFTWLLAGQTAVSPTVYFQDTGDPDASYWSNTQIAIYYILDAASLSGVTSATFTSSVTLLPGQLVELDLDLFESSGLTVLDTVISNTGNNNVENAGTITTTGVTDLIFVAAGNFCSNDPTAGYTFTVNSADYNDEEALTEYLLNATPGTYDTDLSVDFGGNLSGNTNWAAIAVAFASSLPPANLNFLVNGTPLEIPYELVAYQGATLTGPNAYSCGPPIIRGIYQTPVFTHA